MSIKSIIHSYKIALFLPVWAGCLLTGCQEDDVMEIFASGQTWHWSGSYRTDNWANDNVGSSTLSREELGKINDSQDAYNLIFHEDGTLEGNGVTVLLSGTWSANSEDQSISLRIETTGQFTELDKRFVDEIKAGKFYRGDSRLIKLFNLDKNLFIQFYPKGFNH